MMFMNPSSRCILLGAISTVVYASRNGYRSLEKGDLKFLHFHHDGVEHTLEVLEVNGVRFLKYICDGDGDEDFWDGTTLIKNMSVTAGKSAILEFGNFDQIFGNAGGLGKDMKKALLKKCPGPLVEAQTYSGRSGHIISLNSEESYVKKITIQKVKQKPEEIDLINVKSTKRDDEQYHLDILTSYLGRIRCTCNFEDHELATPKKTVNGTDGGKTKVPREGPGNYELLTHGWRDCYDPASGRTYYMREKNGHVQWTHPKNLLWCEEHYDDAQDKIVYVHHTTGKPLKYHPTWYGAL